MSVSVRTQEDNRVSFDCGGFLVEIWKEGVVCPSWWSYALYWDGTYLGGIEEEFTFSGAVVEAANELVVIAKEADELSDYLLATSELKKDAKVVES